MFLLVVGAGGVVIGICVGIAEVRRLAVIAVAPGPAGLHPPAKEKDVISLVLIVQRGMRESIHIAFPIALTKNE